MNIFLGKVRGKSNTQALGRFFALVLLPGAVAPLGCPATGQKTPEALIFKTSGAFQNGSGRRIRTLTNRVRVCRATLTQSRYLFLALGRGPERITYYSYIFQNVNIFFKKI